MHLIPCPWCGLPTTVRDDTDSIAWHCVGCGASGHEVTIDASHCTAQAAAADHLTV